MADMNLCAFTGNLGRDPELRATNAGLAITNISIAVSGRKKVGDQWEDKTTWVPVVLIGRHAEVAGQYLKKGSKVRITGQFSVRKWQDKDGADRYTTEIVASELQMLGGGDSPKPASTGASGYAAASGGRRPAPEPEPAPDFDDDIPF